MTAAAGKASKAPRCEAKAKVVAAATAPTAIVSPKWISRKCSGRRSTSISKAEEQSEVGLTNGLAYTDAGGDMLQIEVSVVPGKGAREDHRQAR